MCAEHGRPGYTKEEKWFNEHRVNDVARVGNRVGKRGFSLHLAPMGAWREYNIIELNNDSMRNFIAVDIDGEGEDPRAEAIERVAHSPVPPLCVVPSPNGCHVVWAIDSTKKGTRADSYAQDAQWNLALVLQADQGYVAHTVRNPVALQAGTVWGELRVYKLGEIKNSFGDKWRYRSPFPSERQRPDGEGRNNALYTHAQNLIRIGHSPEEVLHSVQEMNSENPDPLSASDVRSIVRSATKGKDMPSPHLKQWGRRGGTRNTDAQQEARRRNLTEYNNARQEKAGDRYAQCEELFAQRKSIRCIAKETGIPRSTVSRYHGYYIGSSGSHR